jgi:hypothetical protein
MLATYAYTEIEKLLAANPGFSYMEIGSFDGEGIAMLCKKFPDQQFYSIDPFIEDGHTTIIVFNN